MTSFTAIMLHPFLFLLSLERLLIMYYSYVISPDHENKLLVECPTLLKLIKGVPV